MLVVVVLPFAVLWMPYRSLVLLNSFVAEPFLDPRVLLFCRTCVYANSAVNPIIYSLMSQKFQAAFRQLCQCRAERPQRRMASLSTASYSAVRETPQKAEPAGARPPALRQQGPRSCSRGLGSAWSEGCPPPAQPLPPPSVCSPAGSCLLMAGRARRWADTPLPMALRASHLLPCELCPWAP